MELQLANINFLEWIWIICSWLVTIISLVSIRDAMLDTAALTAARVDGARHTSADNNMRQEVIRLAIGFVMILGSASALLPEEAAVGVRMLAWVLVSILIGLSSVLDRWMRKKIMRYAPMHVSTSQVEVPPTTFGPKDTAGAMVQAAESIRESVNEGTKHLLEREAARDIRELERDARETARDIERKKNENPT